MARSRDNSPEDYEVGYRKPPMHSRWPKGQSGNRAGRPRRRPVLTPENLEDLEMRDAEMLRVMRRTVTVDVDGVPTKMSAREAMLHAAVERVRDGDMRPLKMLTEQAAQADARLAQAEALRTRGQGLDITWLRQIIFEHADLKQQVEQAVAQGFISEGEAERRAGAEAEAQPGCEMAPAPSERREQDERLGTYRGEVEPPSTTGEALPRVQPGRQSVGEELPAAREAESPPAVSVSAPPPPATPQPARIARAPRTVRGSGDPLITNRRPLMAHGWGTGGGRT